MVIICMTAACSKSLEDSRKETVYYKDHKTFDLLPDKSIASNNLGILLHQLLAEAYTYSFNSSADKQAFLDFCCRRVSVSERYNDDR